jgi:hypothetical protein
VDKAKKEKEKTNLEDKIMAASTGQLVNRMKQTVQLITLTVAVKNLGLTNQKLNAIIVKR